MTLVSYLIGILAAECTNQTEKASRGSREDWLKGQQKEDCTDENQQQAGTPYPTSRREHPGNRSLCVPGEHIVNKDGGVDADIKTRINKARSLEGTSSQHRHSRGKSMSHIFKPEIDKKQYREIILQNGLRVLLISDLEQSSHRLSTSGSPVDRQLSLEEKHSDMEESMSGADTDGSSTTDTSHISNCSSQKEDQDEKKFINKRKRKCKKHGPSDTTGKYESMEIVMAAAALCIGSGSFADPPDIPGLSHFLEHMVFMGSKKYRKENAFDDFIARHGGESNACTDTEMTTFFFDIPKQYFYKALDIFAHFFISPLFLKSSVDREIMAIDNEFQMVVPYDLERYHQLLGTLANPGNPVGRFLYGNLKVLKTIPQEQNIDVYGRLREFYKRVYSAHYMTLAIQAPDSLDDLQDLVQDIFHAIPNNKILRPSFHEHRDPFVPEKFHKFLKVVPVEDCHKLEISWALPPMMKHFKSKPLEYIAVPITHEGPGSVLSYLRKRSWALSLQGGNSGSGYDSNSLWSGFFISIVLTDHGLENVAEVIKVLFQYMQLQRQCGPLLWFFTELQEIEDIKFRFKDETDPIDNVEQVSENMQLFPTEYYFTGRSLLFIYDPQVIQECLGYLLPELCCITLLTKNFEHSDICNMVEPYFGTRYTITDIPQDWKDSWTALKPNPELYLPEPNPFIPQVFELVYEKRFELPVRVVDNEFSCMWYKKDSKYKLPKGFIMLHLITPVVSRSVVNAALCDLYLYIIQQNLQESLYPATLAGYEFSMEAMSTGVEIHTEGFSHKLPMVVQCIIEHLTQFKVTPQNFEVVKTQLKKSYYNEMIKPFDFGRMLRFAVTEPSNCSLPDRYLVVSSLTQSMLMNFYHDFLQSVYVEGLVIGNFTAEEAVKIAHLAQNKICKKPLPPEMLPLKRLYQLPIGDLQCRVRGVNRQDTNSIVTSYYQMGPGTIREACLNELLSMRMKEPCFNYLRTELQLGYSVFCHHMTTNGILGYSVSVETQANKFSMSQVERHISKFMENFQKTLNKMTKARYKDLVESVISLKQVEDTQLGDETGRYWQEILDRSYIFDRPDREIATLQTIPLSELKLWYQKYLDRSRRHVSFQVQGAVEVPMEAASKPHKPGTIEDENFLTLVVEGKDFISDVKKFRKELSLYPHSLVTS
ncbi:nardilysin-like isoform X2 [Pomacea canaliculata]|uniref:nardilysin-like isoform X2 n=1 Tax=Pomacea canaliculata TaxID=400727 RepID=UPI000D73C377|nr:nardilysin-like isoform X2 [Pomacea canaliculata]